MSKQRALDLEIADWRPTLENVTWLGVALLLVAIPHASRQPLWVSAAFVVFASWRLFSLRKGWWLPGKWTTALMTFAVVVGIGLEYRTVLGRDAGVALLTILAAMKLLELRFLRDAYITVFLSLFLVITNFLYSQTIGMGAYMVLATLVSVAALITITHGSDGLRGLARGKLAALAVAQAIPVMVVLFFVFPRLPGPLWGLPNDAHAGRTGLSDSMSPGDISSLSQSSAVAFRVKFDGPVPPADSLYWRGPVLEVTDGRKWTRAPRASAPMQAASLRTQGVSLSYEVTLEPSHKRYLFALEMPTGPVSGYAMNSRGEIRPKKPISERMRYRAESNVSFSFAPSSTAELRNALALRPGFHPQARKLARQWREETNATTQLIDRALSHFQQGPFSYTLQPPVLTGDAIDEFLFLSQRGFCEHYAAAFTVLMRAAGVPARVVTGYQGGEWNEVGEYWIVRQRDAHAWAEVWTRSQGWIRVDPTAVVSPDRVQAGIDVAMPETAGDVLLGLAPGGPITRAWRRIRLGWDSVNDSWNQWVLGYGPDSQRRFLTSMGLDPRDWRQAGIIFVVTVALAALATALWVVGRRPRKAPVAKAFDGYCATLAKLGVTRQPWEGPTDFASRARAELPHLSDEIDRITRLYVSVRYASDNSLEAELSGAVKQFRPHPN